MWCYVAPCFGGYGLTDSRNKHVAYYRYVCVCVYVYVLVVYVLVGWNFLSLLNSFFIMIDGVVYEIL